MMTEMNNKEATMKLSKSKLALAKVINENGGWPSDEANFAAQDKIDGESNDNTISFYSGKVKPTRLANNSMWRCENSGSHFMGYEKAISGCELIANWHQACLSIEEYYQAYPKDDADGWIEWKGGMKGPVESGVPVDVKTKDGYVHYDQLLGDACWRDHWGDASIIAYRLHNPEVKPEFCESVTRSIPEPEAKPTIEQLAQDYRNKLDFAKRKQQEADDAKAAADAALGKLERAGEALGLLIGISKPYREPKLVITDWRDLRANDVIFVDECGGRESGEHVVVSLEDDDYDGDYAVMATGIDGCDRWIDTTVEWRFIRRP